MGEDGGATIAAEAEFLLPEADTLNTSMTIKGDLSLMHTNRRNIRNVTFVVGLVFYLALAVAAITAVVGVGVLAGQQFLAPVFEFLQIASIVTLFSSVIGYSVWIYRASSNLWDNHELEFKPAACIWWNLVPIAGLFKPYQAMREIWNTTLGSSNAFAAEDHQTLKLWWACWVVTNILGNVSFRMEGKIDTTLIDVISAFTDVGLYWFAHKIITKIGTAQSEGKSDLAAIFE
jgi:Domain of unknown function (DUF4328)